MRAVKRRTLENIASLYLLQGLNYVLPIILLPYLVRVLGMEEYGLIAFAQSFAQYFTTLTDYGFNYSATRSIAQQDNSSEISRIFSSVMTIKIALALMSAVVLFIITISVPRLRASSSYFYISYFAVLGNTLFPLWYYQGIQKMRYISIISGATRIMGAAAIFIFVHRPSDTLLALSILSLSSLATGIIGIVVVFLWFPVKISRPSMQEIVRSLKEGCSLFVSTFAVNLYTNTNVFLVGLIAGNLEAGYFSAAEKLVRAVNSLIGPIAQAVFPRMNELVQESRNVAIEFARKTLIYMLPVAAIPAALLLTTGGTIMDYCFGHVSSQSISVLRWIGLLPIIISASNVLGVQVMIPFGLDKQFMRILVATGALNVVLASFMIKVDGAKGAAISILFAEILVAACMIFTLERNRLSIFRPEILDEH